MADWPALSQDYNLVTISTASMDSVGIDLSNYFRSTGAPQSTVWPAANRAIFIPFVVYNPFVVVKMGVINGAAVSGNVDVGIYDAGGNYIISKGSTAQATTTDFQSFDITDTTLNPGVYYMACALDNTTGTTAAWTTSVVMCRAAGILSQSTAFPLPTSTATMVAAQDSYVPHMFVTARTLI